MQIEKQKQRLEEEKERLVRELEYYKKEDPYLSPDRGTANTVDDDITEDEGHDRVTATRLALKKDLYAVEEALKSIESGTYGICKNCGEKIEEERLEIMPAARFCLNCEKKRLSL